MERTLKKSFQVELRHFLEMINLKYNYDFQHYSAVNMNRRVILALDQMKCENIAKLQEKVLNDEKCFLELIQYFTIAVTEMFRDPSYFLALREGVVPILKTYPSLKVWVAGCSTGEEVFSLAILFLEEELLERTTFYATDINPKNIEKAQTGEISLVANQNFLQNYLNSGGTKELSDYYSESKSSLKLNDVLLKQITFSDHSLVTDSVFSETHLVSCRNVLIYFDRELQDRAFGLFQESLCRKGFLGLGSKETIQFSTSAKYFDTFSKKERIFQKK